MNDDGARITMSVDLKKNRFRIFKETLHAIGDPNNIYLLYNPERATIGIRAADKKDEGGKTFRIRSYQMAPDNSVELYSQLLIQQISETYSGLTGQCSYRLTGRIVPGESLALFPLDSMQRIAEGDPS